MNSTSQFSGICGEDGAKITSRKHRGPENAVFSSPAVQNKLESEPAFVPVLFLVGLSLLRRAAKATP